MIVGTTYLTGNSEFFKPHVVNTLYLGNANNATSVTFDPRALL